MRHIIESYNSDHDLPDDPFHPFTPDEWETHTATQMRTYLVNNILSHLGPNPVTFVPISSPRRTNYSAAAPDLMGFKKDNKREIAAYPTFKDERYFDSFSRSLFIVAKAHEYSES